MNHYVSSDEVKTSVLATGKTNFVVRECSICYVPIGYHILDERPYWDGSCGCCTGIPVMREWSDLASLINMQHERRHRNHFRELFGMQPEVEQ